VMTVPRQPNKTIWLYLVIFLQPFLLSLLRWSTTFTSFVVSHKFLSYRKCYSHKLNNITIFLSWKRHAFLLFADATVFTQRGLGKTIYITFLSLRFCFEWIKSG
jgi:hypothetical protein